MTYYIIVNYKDLNFVMHKDKDKNDIVSPLNHIKSSVKQELIQQIKNQIKCLSISKQKGNKVELKLTDRIFKCPICKEKEDRDIHATKNMIWFYLQYINLLDEPGTDCTSIKSL